MLITSLSPAVRKSTGIRSMLPQSRKTTVRSAMSAGGSWKTSSSGRKRYSIGSGNSFAARNITESLPSWVRRWCMPSSEPSASPSGPSCAVRRNLSRLRSSSATLSIAGFALTPALLIVLLEQLRYPHSGIHGVVVLEGQGRCPLHSRLGGDLRLQDSVRRAQRVQRRLALVLAPEDADMHLGGAEVRAGLDRGHGHEADARVAEVGGDRRADHLAQH